MKKYLVFACLAAFVVCGANGATARRSVPSAAPAAANTTSGRSGAAGTATNARAATRTTAARSATKTPTSTGTVAARAATRTTAARSATTPTVSARAATTQKVVGTGTKVATATKNITVSQECQDKYMGCMDSFCMLENETGGRCICSDKNAELDEVLAEIEKLDQQSYQMATAGVERLEMGDDADAAIANANAAAQAVAKEKEENSRRKLDLSLWNQTFDEDISIFEDSDMVDPLAGKEGDALYRAASEICVAQVPECASDLSMLQLMYSQRVRNDCAAYENSLKQQKTASSQKLAAAEQALRNAALEQYRSANKYDLGQCTVEFKNCMIATGGCGSDFANCASVSALDTTSLATKKGKNKDYKIKGATAEIVISGSTYDTLMAKKPLCDGVTKSCVAVKDQVWDTFLKEVAPQLKSAELIAEDNARQNCIGNISDCFQKACKDNIDPNDPDGSYDLCLSRPGAMLNVCKIPLNNCGIDASSETAAQQSVIWDYVVARLASMRVDSCTTELKECLQSDDRCGQDYTQCIGLDTDTIIRMCPYEKLTGCQKVYGEDNITDDAVYDQLASLVQGIFLNIDNNFLSECQNKLTQKMVEVCGDTLSCDMAFADDSVIGTESLLSYKNNAGDTVIEGLVSFGNLQVSKVTESTDPKDTNVKFGVYDIDINGYKKHLEDGDQQLVDRVTASLESVASTISQKINIIATDPQIDMCLNGRDVRRVGIKGESIDTDSTGRPTNAIKFPHMMDSAAIAIINSGLDQAKKNYDKKYDELVSAAIEDQNDAMKMALCAAMATNPDSEPDCLEQDPETGICTKFDNSTPYQDYFGSEAVTGLQGEGYAMSYVINGANLEKQLKVASSGRGEFVQVDPTSGNMLGRIDISATYSADKNSCLLTTTTTMCSDVEKIVDKLSIGKMKRGYNITYGDLQLSGKKIKKVTLEMFKGIYCEKFNEPVITTNSIKM